MRRAGGEWPRERRRFIYSKTKFVWRSLSLNSLHNWLVMNVSVARYLAEKSAVDELAEVTPRVKYLTLESNSQHIGPWAAVAPQVDSTPTAGASQGPSSPGSLMTATV